MAESRFSEPAQRALERRLHDLLGFSMRFDFLAGVDAKIREECRGKEGAVRDSDVWRMLGNDFRALVIDLASWTRALYGDGGFLRCLQGSDLKALRSGWKYEERDDDELGGHWRDLNVKHRRAALVELFPNRAHPTHPPNNQDAIALAERLASAFEALRDDRHQRAHPYEEVPAAKMLDLPELAVLLRQCEALFRGLLLLSANRGIGGFGPTGRAPESNEESIADAVLIGPAAFLFTTTKRSTREHFYQRRAELYERLHAEHDRLGEPEKPFNRPDVFAVILDRNYRWDP